MEIEGQIEEIIYQNEVNSYTIALLEMKEETLTVVGYLPFITQGDTLKLFGKFVTHQEYGRQFKIDTFEKLMPKSLQGLEKYLAGGIIKGVGPSIAKKIVDKFGEETISVFKFEPQKLSQIKGISDIRAIEMAEEFNEKWELWQIVGFLERFGISPSNCKKVYEELGNDAITKIEENPYILLDVAYGVDFKQIDKMAMNLGIANNHVKRVEGAIKYALTVVSYNGNTCVEQSNLISFVTDLLDVTKEEIEDSIINLKGRKEIIFEDRKNSIWVYLEPFYQAEKNISQKLLVLQKCKNSKKISNFQVKQKKQEEKLDIILSDKQKEAISMVNDNNVCVITGGPGTGKTTIIKCIIEMFKEEKKKVVLCAPTGRAAKRMTETTNESASTIHRLLELGKMDENKIANVDFDISPIDADVIIIDEMSMVDMFLMNYIVKGIYMGTKLVMVGDSNQLPSVGPGNVLKDIIESENIPTIELNKIFRQAAKSKIILNAHNVNNGDKFIERNQKEELIEDFFYINENSQEKMLYQVVSLCTGRLKKYGDYDFFQNIQVLTPTKKGMLGTKELNKQLQEALNPESNNKHQKTYGEITFRQGDRIMQVKNNYDIFWEKNSGEEYETGTGVFNGELGTIQKIDEIEKSIQVLFDDNKIAWYNYSELDEIEHAYAITIHKSQR